EWSTMHRWNNTVVPYFILTGFTDAEDIQLVLFVLFLLIYLVTVLGNAGMIMVIRLDTQLHTPMYFFLSHLSFIDLSNSSVFTPKTIENLLTSNKISYMNCFTQMYFFIFLTGTECFLLSSMAYDRYVAICNPLHYPVVMSTRRCWSLVFGSFVIGFMDSLGSVLSVTKLYFCNSNVIHHFFCDLSPILALSCTVTQDTELMIFILAGSTLMVSLITLSVSYVSILSTIMKINSASGKRKAFSTFASHMLVVTIFYGTLIFTYLKPRKSYSLGNDQVASVFYTIVTPMLNPLIYSLRNKEVKNAVLRLLQKNAEDIQLVLFVLFLLIYLVTVLGNAGMITVIRLDSHLHSPMYFFLSHLSFIDLSYSTVITPKTVENLLISNKKIPYVNCFTQIHLSFIDLSYSNVITPKTIGNLLTSNKKISYVNCFTQMYFFIFFGGAECFLLSSMAYDRYVAICNPLHYPIVMSSRRCSSLVFGSYVVGFIDSLVNEICMSRLKFCNSNVIHHFFCDSSPILALSCTETKGTEVMIFIFALSTLMVSLITISVSYMSILSTILKINSTSGKKKAFSTCASHMLAVTIFYGTMIFTYLKPSKSYSLGKDQVASVFYTIVTPMLNPLIYSLHNKEVKNAVLRLLQKSDVSRHLK
ncbi:Olfactory receptor 8H3, partial [Galemys pyrenaicus]